MLGEERAVARGGGELVGRTRLFAGGDDGGDDIIVLASAFSSIAAAFNQRPLHPPYLADSARCRNLLFPVGTLGG